MNQHPVPWLAPRSRRGLGAPSPAQTIALDYGSPSQISAGPAADGTLLTVTVPSSAIVLSSKATAGVRPVQGIVNVNGNAQIAPIYQNPDAILVCFGPDCTGTFQVQFVLNGQPGTIIVSWTDTNYQTTSNVTINLQGTPTPVFHPGPVHLPTPTVGPPAPPPATPTPPLPPPPTPTPVPPVETSPNPNPAPASSSSTTTIVVASVGLAALAAGAIYLATR